MTRTTCASTALACIIAPWAAKIVAILRAIVETILAIAEDTRSTLPELGACSRKAGRRLPALRPHTCKRSPELGQAIMMDLRALNYRASAQVHGHPGRARTQ